VGASQPHVLVVDKFNGPGTDYLSINKAVGAASEGDTVLVRSGTYKEIVVIDAKSILLQEDTGAAVRVDGIEIRNLGANQRAVVSGIGVRKAPLSFGTIVSGNSGRVLFENCVLRGQTTINSGALVFQSAEVVLRDCSVLGEKGDPTEPLPALLASQSKVYVFGGRVVGADGYHFRGKGGCAQPTDGFRAIEVYGGTIWILRARVVGGDGADGTSGNCRNGGDGATAVFLSGIDPVVRAIRADVAGGLGGAAGLSGRAGADGDPYEVMTGQFFSAPPSTSQPSPPLSMPGGLGAMQGP
jgi:hypothetical protein